MSPKKLKILKVAFLRLNLEAALTENYEAVKLVVGGYPIHSCMWISPCYTKEEYTAINEKSYVLLIAHVQLAVRKPRSLTS